MLDTPSLALANATRETVGVCETIEIMLRRIIDLYENPEQERIDELSALDDKVDRKHAAIKLYLAKLTTKSLSDFEVARAQELLGACVKLEQVGDIIVRNMLALVQKKMDRKLKFTDEGWLELSNFHAKVLTNARMAFNVLVSRDRETAHQLVLEKGSFAGYGKTKQFPAFQPSARRHDPQPGNKFHSSRYDPRPEADQFIARSDGLSCA